MLSYRYSFYALVYLPYEKSAVEKHCLPEAMNNVDYGYNSKGVNYFAHYTTSDNDMPDKELWKKIEDKSTKILNEVL